MNKIHRPDLVRPRCWTTIFPKLRFDTSLGRLFTQLKAQAPLKPIRFLDVDIPAFPAQQNMHAPIPVTYGGLADLLNARRKLGLLRTAGPVRVGRSLDLKDSAGAPDRHAPIASNPIDQIPLPGRP